MPVYKSGNIMPVESDYERKVLDLIIGLIARNRNKEEYTVEKPLFGMQTTNKERYRPDFIITRETTGFTIYIEVLGSQNIDYLNHKEIIAKRATGYCDKYLSIRGYNFYNEKAEFIKKLKLYLIH